MEVLDGDNLVKELKLTDWSRKGRIKHSERVTYLAKSFLERDISVCIAKISPYKEMRIEAENILNQYKFIELFVKCSLEICAKRDVKGMYKKARNGKIKNFTGIDDIFEEPKNPDIIINTNDSTVDECVEKILRFIEEHNT